MAIENTWQGFDLGQMFPNLKKWKDALQSEHDKLTAKISNLTTKLNNIQSKLDIIKSAATDAKNLTDSFVDNTTKLGVYVLGIDPVIGGNAALKTKLREALVSGTIANMPQFKDNACMYGFLMVMGGPTFNDVENTYKKLKKQYGVAT